MQNMQQTSPSYGHHEHAQDVPVSYAKARDTCVPRAENADKMMGYAGCPLFPERPLQIPEAQRLKDVRLLDPLLPGEVGDRARHLHDAADRAHGQVVLFARALQQRLTALVQRAVAVHLPRGQLRVARGVLVPVARLLAVAGGLHALADDCGRLLRRAGGDLLHRHGGHLQLHVDAVEQGPGDAREVARDVPRLAAAGLRAAAVIAAGLCCVY